jgi:hypothetical protein
MQNRGTEMSTRHALYAVLALAGVQAATANAAIETAETISYRVKPGDSLYRLSEKYLINKAAYVSVQRLNRITNPYALPPGSTLLIPTRLLRATPLDAQLAAFQGSVRIENQGASLAPSLGMPIREGVIVQTGNAGFATLLLSDGSRVTLPSNSRVRILHMRRFLLTSSTDFDFALDQGRAETSVTKIKDNNSRFRLRTPIAVSAVRGTKFRIGYDPGQGPSLTEVVEGRIWRNRFCRWSGRHGKVAGCACGPQARQAAEGTCGQLRAGACRQRAWLSCPARQGCRIC